MTRKTGVSRCNKFIVSLPRSSFARGPPSLRLPRSSVFDASRRCSTRVLSSSRRLPFRSSVFWPRHALLDLARTQAVMAALRFPLSSITKGRPLPTLTVLASSPTTLWSRAKPTTREHTAFLLPSILSDDPRPDGPGVAAVARSGGNAQAVHLRPRRGHISAHGLSEESIEATAAGQSVKFPRAPVGCVFLNCLQVDENPAASSRSVLLQSVQSWATCFTVECEMPP